MISTADLPELSIRGTGIDWKRYFGDRQYIKMGLLLTGQPFV